MAKIEMIVSVMSLFFAVGMAEADSSSQDALGLSKLGGQAEKNRKMQKK